MFMRLLITGASFAGLLAACAAVDPVDTRYDTVNRTLTKARDESIFLNLVRASHNYPLSFTTISNVTPSLTNTTSFGLPAFVSGPAPVPATIGRDVIYGNTTASNSTAISTNFSVSTEETSAFYLGFLKPIDLQTLAYFIRQGYSRELLFWLFTDSFEISYPKRGITYGYRYDPPNDYGCDPNDHQKGRCFIHWVHLATLVGLTVEEKSEEKINSGKVGEGSNNAGGSSKPTTTVYARFCNSKVLGRQAQEVVRKTEPGLLQEMNDTRDVSPAELYDREHACSTDWSLARLKKPQPDAFPLDFRASGVVFKIIPRSAYGVFKFLGAVMKMQLEKPSAAPYIPSRRNPEIITKAPELASVTGDRKLITVERNYDNSVRCYAHTYFYDGDYCVPESADNTKLIFGLLAQLIAIQTSATDLSITPLVRVIQ
jgi:hypothetical protein